MLYDENIVAQAMIMHAAERFRKVDSQTGLDFSRCIFDGDKLAVSLIDLNGATVFYRTYTQVGVRAIVKRFLALAPREALKPTPIPVLLNYRRSFSKKLGNWK